MRHYKFKSMLSLFLAVSMMLTMLYGITFPVKATETDNLTDTIVDSGICGDTLSWTLYSDGTLIVTGTGMMYDYSNDPAPWHPYRKTIQSIVIEDEVRSIGTWSFSGCDSLKIITIGENVKSIGAFAFDDCDELMSVKLPGGLTDIGGRAFSLCDNLVSLFLGENIVNIEENAFAYCNNLDHIVYAGTEEQWKNVNLQTGNELLLDSMWHYECESDDLRIIVGCEFYRTECAICEEALIAGRRWNGSIPDGVHAFSGGVCAYCGVPEGCAYSLTDDAGNWGRSIGKSLIVTAFNKDAVIVEVPVAIEGLPVTNINSGAIDSAWDAQYFIFFGDAPIIEEDAFKGKTRTCFYPEDNNTWTEEILRDYGGKITWVAHSGECPMVFTEQPRGATVLYGATINFEVSTNKDDATYQWQYKTPTGDWTNATEEGNRTATLMVPFVQGMAGYHYRCAATDASGNTIYSDSAELSLLEATEIELGVTYQKREDAAFGAFDCYYFTPDTTDCYTLICNGSESYFAVLDINMEDMEPVAEENYLLEAGNTYIFFLERAVEKSCVMTLIVTHDYSCTDEQQGSCEDGDKKTFVCNYCQDSYEEVVHDYNEDNICQNCGVAFSVYGTCGGSLTWVLDSQGKLTISGTGAMMDFETVLPPWYPYAEKITNVVIEEGITSIGDYAFSYCANLSSITIPISLENLGEGSFEYCSNLMGIWTDENSAYYSSDENGILFSKDHTVLVRVPAAFDGSLTIPDSVTHIADNALSNCLKLTSVEIPDTVTSIGVGAFKRCISLLRVELPSGIDAIEDSAFMGCNRLESISIPDGVLTIGTEAFKCCGELTNVTLPGSVTRIEVGAFSACWSLTSITIPSRVTAMERYAFIHCWALSSIQFCGNAPAFGTDVFISVTATAYYPAGNTTWTENVMQDYGGDITWQAYDADNTIAVGKCGDNLIWILDKAGTLTISGSGAMENFESGSSAWYHYRESIINVVIEEGATSIGKHAFEDCTNLTSINIPESVTSIGEFVFEDCIYLTDVQLPMGITRIEAGLFLGCKSLRNIVLPANIAIIGEGAFTFCDMESIIIPENVSGIDDNAFCGCHCLTSIHFSGNLPVFGEDVFKDVTATAHYPAGNTTWTEEVMQDYGGDIAWVGYTQTVASGECGENLTWKLDELGMLTIWGTGNMEDYESGSSPWNDMRESIKTVVIEAGVTSIGDHAFSNCNKLSSIVIPEGITNIGKFAFFYCKELSGITLPESLTSIADWAFDGCYSLTDVVLPENVTSMGVGAFAYCINLSSITLPRGIQGISELAFSGCRELKNITIRESVTSIGDSAFSNCSGLESIQFLEDAPVFGGNVFNGVAAAVHYPAGNETWTEELKKDYGGNITWVAYSEPEIDPFTISLAQVELGNALNLNFLFLADSYADWTGCYAVLTKTYADGRDNVTVTVPADQWEDKPSGGKQYKRIGFHNISAKEMADEISIVVYNADGVAISNQHSDSIVGYLERMLGKNSNAEFRTLAVDMLNYGAAAQTQFNYNLDNLANANIGDYQQYATATDAVCVNNQVKGDNVRGTSVSLENNIVMNVYFTNQTADMTAEVTFKNHAGTDMTVVLTSVDTSNGYCFQIDKLAVADMRTMVTITCKDADGNVYGTLTDSVEGYVARTGATKAINQAIMKFADSAYAYLH